MLFCYKTFARGDIEFARKFNRNGVTATAFLHGYAVVLRTIPPSLRDTSLYGKGGES